MSYATAEESLHSPPRTPAPFESQLSLGGYESAAAETPVNSAPPTPRLEARHVLEGTDATVTH